MILFLFDYSLYMKKDNLVGFEVHKVPYTSNDKIVLNELQERTCKDTCKPRICNMYQQQVKKYNLCKECETDDKCYDPYLRRCMDCRHRETCEKTFGCDEGEPIDPVQSFCQPCWNQVAYATPSLSQELFSGMTDNVHSKNV